MPSVRIQDNMQLPANAYVIRVKEIEAGRGEVRPTMLLAMDPRGEPITLPGEKTKEPTFGLPALWMDPSPPRGGAVPRADRGRPGDGGHHPPDRGDQGPHGDAAVLRRDPQAARRARQGPPEAGRRPDPQPDFLRRRAAGAAEPAGRAHLDPRPADHPRGHLRGLRAHPQRHPDHRARAGAAGPADQRACTPTTTATSRC